MIPRMGQSEAPHSFISEHGNPNSKNWKRHVNICCLGPEPKRHKAPAPIMSYPTTPVSKHGTLIGDDGNGALLRTRRKSDHGSYPQR